MKHQNKAILFGKLYWLFNTLLVIDANGKIVFQYLVAKPFFKIKFCIFFELEINKFKLIKFSLLILSLFIISF